MNAKSIVLFNFPVSLIIHELAKVVDFLNPATLYIKIQYGNFFAYFTT
jgi:hypothetical protein